MSGISSPCFFLVVLLVIFIQQNVGQSNVTYFEVRGRYIYLNGELFTVKGINYSPTPAGCDPYYCGNGDQWTNDWSFIHDRDFPLLRAIHCNAIRTYTWRDDNPEANLDHFSFLDKAWNNGIDPVYVMATIGFGWGSEDARNEARNRYRINAIRYGSHPAFMGFVIGNEMNSGEAVNSEVYWRFVNELAGIVREEAPGKLTSMSVVDDGMWTPTVGSSVEIDGQTDLPNIHVWGINAYRGTRYTGFDSLFSSFYAVSEKPLLITEYGPPASTRDPNDITRAILMPENALGQADYIESHWNDIMAHRCVSQGGFVFAWTDEWWKAGEVLIQNVHQNGVGAFPGGWWDEEWFGINGIIPNGPIEEPRTRGADTLAHRAAYYRIGELFNNVVDPVPENCTFGGGPGPAPPPPPVVAETCDANQVCFALTSENTLVWLTQNDGEHAEMEIPAAEASFVGVKPPEHLQSIFTTHHVYGSFEGGPTTISFWVDARSAIGQAIEAEVSFDYDGDGIYEDSEVFPYFATNPINDFELYQVEGETRTRPDMMGGSIRVTLWSALMTAEPLPMYAAVNSPAGGRYCLLKTPFGSNETPQITDYPSASPTPTASTTPDITSAPNDTETKSPDTSVAPDPSSAPPTTSNDPSPTRDVPKEPDQKEEVEKSTGKSFSFFFLVAFDTVLFFLLFKQNTSTLF